MAKQAHYLGWLNGGVISADEVRAEALDKEPWGGEWAKKAPANSVLYQAYAAEQQKLIAQMPQPATAGGPLQPPNNLLNKPELKDDRQPSKAAFPPPGPGTPPAGAPAPGPSPKPPAPVGPPKPFGKSLAEATELHIEFEWSDG